MWLRGVLPGRHLDNQTKELVKLGVGLVGTMAALLLGLLAASAKSSCDTRRSELTQIAASTILLDRSLAHYGPVTIQIRGILKIGLRGQSIRYGRETVRWARCRHRRAETCCLIRFRS